MITYHVRKNDACLFGAGRIENAYAYLMEKLCGRVWVTLPNESLSVLVKVLIVEETRAEVWILETREN